MKHKKQENAIIKYKKYLIENVEKWFKQLQSTTFYIYDLTEKQQRQKYDVSK